VSLLPAPIKADADPWSSSPQQPEQTTAHGTGDALDLKAESDRLVQGYRREAMVFAGLGILAISLVLLCGLKHPATVLRVLLPVLIAVVLNVAGLWLMGERLNVFHLVALLLVIGIGLNYALFFNRQAQDREDRARTALALALCLSTTLSAFGCLAASKMPVLHAIGVTVSSGALLALVCAAMLVQSKVITEKARHWALLAPRYLIRQVFDFSSLCGGSQRRTRALRAPPVWRRGFETRQPVPALGPGCGHRP
jgi:predicted exporter